MTTHRPFEDESRHSKRQSESIAKPNTPTAKSKPEQTTKTEHEIAADLDADVDEAIDESFPASDPPAYSTGIATPSRGDQRTRKH